MSFSSPAHADAIVIDPVITKDEFVAAMPSDAEKAFTLYMDIVSFLQKPFVGRKDKALCDRVDAMTSKMTDLGAFIGAVADKPKVARIRASYENVWDALIVRLRAIQACPSSL